jgi:hypothetical protein
MSNVADRHVELVADRLHAAFPNGLFMVSRIWDNDGNLIGDDVHVLWGDEAPMAAVCELLRPLSAAGTPGRIRLAKYKDPKLPKRS